MAKKTKENISHLYNNRYLEVLSITPFWVPLVLFLPVIVYYVITSFQVLSQMNAVLEGILWSAIGLVTWSLMEYLVHRFVFHYQPKGLAAKRFIYLVHGIHHDHPDDLDRLVMPFSVTTPMSIILFFAFGALPLGNEAYNALFYAFFGLGYLCYDMIHYATHALSGKKGLFYRIKKNHMNHHYKEPDKRYGVSSGLWDVIFQSRGEREGQQTGT